MASDSPAALLYDHNGNRLIVQDGEVLGVDLPAVTGGAANQQFGVITAGVDENDNATIRFIRVTDAGELVVKVPPLDADAIRARGVDLRRTGLGDDTVSLLLDLNNKASDVAADFSGPYKHQQAGDLIIAKISASAIKGQANSAWDVSFCIILDIDGTQATLARMEIGTLHFRSQDAASTREQWSVTAPQFVNYGVPSPNTFDTLATNSTLTTPLVNTATQLNNIAGNPITPEIGDVILLTELVSGGGTLAVHYQLWYSVE